MVWTTTGRLLPAIRRRARLPDDDPDFTNANLLAEADTQLYERFVPVILGVREEYYQRHEDQAIAQGVSLYPIPHRGTSSTLREVLYVESGSDPRVYQLPMIPNADTHWYSSVQGRPQAYTIRDDQVELRPTPASTDGSLLRLVYEYRPGSLIETSAAWSIDSKTATSLTTTGAASWSAGQKVDLQAGNPPFSAYGIDLLPASGPSPFTFASGVLPDRIVVGDDVSGNIYGDWVVPTGQAVIPQIPAEMQDALALAVAAEVLTQLGMPEAQTVMGRFEMVLDQAQRLIAPRKKGTPDKIVSRASSLRTRRRRNRNPWGDFVT